MKRLLFLSLFVSASALAYKDGVYKCKNAEGLPDNVYKITSQTMVGGDSLPYLEAHRYYKTDAGKVVEGTVRGLASVSRSSDTAGEILMVGYLRLEFDGDMPYNCKQ